MRIRLLDPKFARNWRRYVGQSSLATVTLMVTLWVADLITGANVARAVLVASIGSTAFLLFISPRSTATSPRHVLGGHAIAVIVAAPFALFADSVFGLWFAADVALLVGVYSAVAVGVAMLGMAALNAERTPAAGTALAVVAHGFDWVLVAFIATAVLILSAAHAALRRYMLDLY